MQYGSDWGVEGASSSPVIATFFPQRNNPGIVDVAINNINTNLTTDEYLNKLMQEIANPNIRFTIHTTNNVTLAKLPQIKAVTIGESLEKAISVDLLKAVIPQ